MASAPPAGAAGGGARRRPAPPPLSVTSLSPQASGQGPAPSGKSLLSPLGLGRLLKPELLDWDGMPDVPEWKHPGAAQQQAPPQAGALARYSSWFGASAAALSRYQQQHAQPTQDMTLPLSAYFLSSGHNRCGAAPRVGVRRGRSTARRAGGRPRPRIPFAHPPARCAIVSMQAPQAAKCGPCGGRSREAGASSARWNEAGERMAPTHCFSHRGGMRAGALTCARACSYLHGDQLTSRSGTRVLRSCLQQGCRVVELDIWDGKDLVQGPIVTHGGTLTGRVSIKVRRAGSRDGDGAKRLHQS